MIRRKAAIGVGIAVGIRSLSLPLTANAQRAARTYLIGILSQGKRYPPVVDDLSMRLREIGRAGGFTVKFEERWADDHWEALPMLAAELVALRVDVTGLSILGPEMELKRLELLKEVAPKITRMAVITNSAANDLAAPLRLLQLASQSLGVQLSLFDVRVPSDLAKALEQMAQARVQGILVQDDYMLNLLVQQVATFALKQQLPLAAEGMQDGVLVAYRFDWDDHFLRASRLIGKILNGADPGDLPVEQPTRFELVIDLRTAKALGLPIPNSMLMRADRVLR